MPGQVSEALLSAIEEVRDQRDALYSATVDPRRNAIRALKVLDGQNIGGVSAREFLEDVVRDLEQVAALYLDYTRSED
jgi:methyl coenzyme M reductase gamma subunit